MPLSECNQNHEFHVELIDNHGEREYVIFNSEGYVMASIKCDRFSDNLTKKFADELVDSMNYAYDVIQFNKTLRH